MKLEERFWKKVNKHGHKIRSELGRCWIWTGSLTRKGYGRIWYKTFSRPAAQVAWELENGKPFPKGKYACHHCDNPPCVRESHIYVGDDFTNAQDRLRRGRHNFANQTHCLRGHLLNSENIYHYKTRRRCRTCLRIRCKKHYAKMRAQGYWKSGKSKTWRLLIG